MGVGSTKLVVNVDGKKLTAKVKIKESKVSAYVAADDGSRKEIGVEGLSIYKGQEVKVMLLPECGKWTSYDVFDPVTMQDQSYSDEAVNVSRDQYYWDDYYGDGQIKTVITGRHAGTALVRLFVYDDNDRADHAAFFPVTVKECGIAGDGIYKHVGTQYKPDIVDATAISFESEDPSVVSVDPDGTMNFLAEGSTRVNIRLRIKSGGEFIQSVNVYSMDPKLRPCSAEFLVTGDMYAPSFEGAYYSDGLKITANNDNVKVYGEGYDAYIIPVKGGETTLTYEIDGCRLKETINILDINISPKSIAVPKGKQETITVTGADGYEVSFKTAEGKIASVTSDGVVKGKKKGNTYITVTIGDRAFILNASVGASKANIKAMRRAEEVIGSSYSQEKRMQKGFYDCSSLCWRSYHDTGKDIGGSKTYAPTAADLARWMVENDKAIATEAVSTADLRPGDLIFYKGSYDNGRYLQIDHVAIYYGPNFDGGYDWYRDYGYYGEGSLYEYSEKSGTNYGLAIHATSAGVRTLDYSYRTGDIVIIARP